MVFCATCNEHSLIRHEKSRCQLVLLLQRPVTSLYAMLLQLLPLLDQR
jgi:hypothetical protein